MKKNLQSLLLACILCTAPAYAEISGAEKTNLTDAYILYKKGAYNESITKLEQIQSANRETQASVAYFLGINHSKLQDFKKASAEFAKSVKLGDKTESLQYEYGQALYAVQHLQEAREAFKKSIAAKYKISASAYYVAFISQSLDENEVAKEYYSRIQKLNKDLDKVKQPSLFQLAEIANELNEAEKNEQKKLKNLDNNILPLYEKAKYFDDSTATATQAESRIKEIQQKLSAAAPKMRNGIPIPRKAYTLRFTQDFEYDSNVITRADESITQVSNQDSLILRATVMAKYQMNFAGLWSVTPELSPSFTFHLRRSVPGVYQNDNLSVTGAIRNKYEHTIKKSPATTLIEAEFNYMLRDYQQQHHLPFYSRYYNFILGERAKIFDTGSTTFKMNFKFFESQNPDRNSITPGLSLTQNIKIASGKYDLSNTLTADALISRNDFNDEKNYKIRSSVTFPNIATKTDFTTAASIAVKDTMKQSGSRGNEIAFNPSFTLTQNLTDKKSVDIAYDFTKNWSKSKDTYQYTKNDIKVSASFSF